MRWRRCLLALMIGVVVLAADAAASSAKGFGFHRDSRATFQSPGGWDEPSGIGGDGRLWVASQNPNATPDTTLTDSAKGLKWSEDKSYYSYLGGRPEEQLGDVTMASDRAGTVFLGHLTMSLQADIDWSRDGGKTWHTANDIVTQVPSPGAASNSLFLVDRPWIAAYSPDRNFKDTKVYLEYHDFVTSDVYIVTCSMTTGSLQCGVPIAVSNPQTACNSIPGGVAVSPPGSKHPGRVYAVWNTADPLTNVFSGCNYTQLAPFYAIYVAYSDTPSVLGSWHQAPVYIGPTGASQDCPDTALVGGFTTNTCADSSELFTPIAVDRAGNAYVSFVDYSSTLHNHYDVYVAHSTNGGSVWDGRSDGKGKPALVGNDGGTHFIPNLVAGSNGRVAVIYYTTKYADKPFMKGATCPSGLPPENPCQGKARPEPPSASWVVDVSVSLNAAGSSPRYTQYQVSDPGVVVHYGDICNLGIYCDNSSTGNRSLFENNTVFLDKNGYLIAAWGDQRLDPHLRSDAGQSDAGTRQVAFDAIYATCQSSGPSLFSSTPKSVRPPCAAATHVRKKSRRQKHRHHRRSSRRPTFTG